MCKFIYSLLEVVYYPAADTSGPLGHSLDRAVNSLPLIYGPLPFCLLTAAFGGIFKVETSRQRLLMLLAPPRRSSKFSTASWLALAIRLIPAGDVLLILVSFSLTGVPKVNSAFLHPTLLVELIHYFLVCTPSFSITLPLNIMAMSPFLYPRRSRLLSMCAGVFPSSSDFLAGTQLVTSNLSYWHFRFDTCTEYLYST